MKTSQFTPRKIFLFTCSDFICSFGLFCITMLLSFKTLAQGEFKSEKQDIDNEIKNNLKIHFKDYKSLKLNIQSVKNYIRKNKKSAFEPVIFYLDLDGEKIKFNLFENDIYDENYYEIKDGKKIGKAQIEISTYAGFVGDNDSDYLRLTITDDWLTGQFRYKNIEYVIENLAMYDIEDKNNLHKNTVILAKSDAVISYLSDNYCGIKNTVKKNIRVATVTYPGYTVPCTTPSVPVCKFLQMLICCDSQFLGSQNTQAKSNTIINYVNQIDRIYAAQTDIRLRIKLISNPIVYDTSNDPFIGFAESTGSSPSGWVNVGAAMSNYATKRIQVFGNNGNSVIHYFLSGKKYAGNNAGSPRNELGQSSEPYHLGRFVSQVLSSNARFVEGTNISPIDTYLVMAHEIGHLIGANHPTDVGLNCSPKTIMCEGEGKTEAFNSYNVNEIACFFATYPQGLQTISGSPYFSNELTIKLNGNNINSTPVLINGLAKTLDLFAPSAFKTSPPTSYTSNDSRVYFYYKNTASTRFEIRTAPSFNMTISASDQCNNYFRTIPFVYSAAGARVAATVYPNPTTNEINVDDENDEIQTEYIEIYSRDGQLVSKTIGKKVNISNLKNDTYFMKLFKNDSSVETKQVIVNK